MSVMTSSTVLSRIEHGGAELTVVLTYRGVATLETFKIIRLEGVLVELRYFVYPSG
jgi:hypothetical protein